MKKIVFLFLLLCSFSLSATQRDYSSFIPDDDDEDEAIDIGTSHIMPPNGPKRMPAYIPVSATIHHRLLCIEVTFLAEIGEVSIMLTNLSTGESSTMDADSLCGTVFIPLPGTPGLWKITFSLSNGTCYEGMFTTTL